ATLLASGTIGTSSISFTGFSASAADDDSLTLSVRISLKDPLGSGVADHQNFAFQVTNANATANTNGTSSIFGAFAAATSDTTKNEIAVTATKLKFTTEPPGSTSNNTNFSAAVSGVDANNNIDQDYTSSVTLTRIAGTGALSAVSTLTKAAV